MGRGLKTVERIRRRRMKEFDSFQPQRPGTLRTLEESRRSLKNKREQKVEEGSRETDWGREDQLIPNWSTYHRTEAKNIQSNPELEAKPVVVVVWRGGEAREQKGRWGGRAARAIFAGRPSDN
jgi:hypothetical protein